MVQCPRAAEPWVQQHKQYRDLRVAVGAAGDVLGLELARCIQRRKPGSGKWLCHACEWKPACILQIACSMCNVLSSVEVLLGMGAWSHAVRAGSCSWLTCCWELLQRKPQHAAAVAHEFTSTCCKQLYAAQITAKESLSEDILMLL
jgi:hypothetical protein